jgi:hypothetical protein
MFERARKRAFKQEMASRETATAKINQSSSRRDRYSGNVPKWLKWLGEVALVWWFGIDSIKPSLW